MKLKKYRFALRNNSLLALLFCVGIFFGAASPVFAVGVCSTAGYNTSSAIPVGGNPRQIITGDLNGDNAPDMVVLGGNSSNSASGATVLINDGRGGFTTSTNLSFNFSVIAAALADFNQDGALDLAAAGFGSSGSGGTSPVVIYFGNGNGNFGAQTSFNAPGTSSAIAAGDFNSDGAPDIVLASSTSNNFGIVSLFLNTGFGNFTFAGSASVSSIPRTINVADFNGDGKQDVVTVNANSTGSLLFGNGAGGFQLASNFNIATNSFSSFSGGVAVGDLNNDGKPDLAAASPDSNNFVVLLNNGTGFGNPVVTTFPNTDYRPRSITIGQFVGDANLDIAVVVNSGYSESVSAAVIVPGNGNGTFNANNLVTAPTGSSPVFIADADFNRDGRDDIATANSLSNDVSVLLNSGADKYGPNTFPTAGPPIQIAAADFNSDGNLDTAAVNLLPNSNGGIITLYLSDGRGGISGTQNITGAVTLLYAIDFNNDSRPDLVVANGLNNVYVYLNTGSATLFNSLPEIALTAGFPVRNITVGDFNNDGKSDLVVGSSNSNSIAVALSAASGTYGAFTTFASPVGSPLVTKGDFNRDGNLDLVVAGNGSSGSGGIFTLLGNGRGMFSQAAGSVSTNTPTSITSGDFNGDSLLDVAVTNAPNFSNSANAVTVAFGNGDGSFGQINSYTAGINPTSIMAGDFNGDARPDLIVINRSSNSVSILTNVGNGFFGAANTFLAGILPETLAFGDFNKDGRSDVATANRGGNNFSILLNSCQEAVTKTDYTSDGKTDFAVFRPSNSTWYVLDNNGRESTSQQFGATGDIPVPGDYDGDGKTDFAVFRPSNSTWYVLRSSTKRFYAVSWGTTGDVPVANDYDGDGRTDIAVWRPSNGVWYIIRSTAPSRFFAVQFGSSADRPAAADYDGDGHADIAVYRGGTWIILQSSDSSVRYAQFGISTDVPVPGDYDGDGKSDLAVYRGGIWYILQSAGNSFRAESFGLSTDRPQQGDYDGDGKTDIAVYRPGGNNWYVLQSSNRQFRGVNWGIADDIPVSSIYRY